MRTTRLDRPCARNPRIIARLRGEQAGLRKAVLRVYQIQREEFLPSAPGSTTRHARKPALRAGSG